MPIKDLYYQKYLKYKSKYINLQSQMGGGVDTIKQFYDEQLKTTRDDIKTFTSLKEKLRLAESTTKEDMFISVPIIVYDPEYLDYNEIIMLAEIFTENSSTPSSNSLIKYMTGLSEPLVDAAKVPLEFKFEDIKRFIIVPFQYYIKFNFNNIYINDNQLHFELLFIFICILLTNKQTDVLFNSDFSFLSIDLKIYQKSFNTIIIGLKQNIIIKLTINSCMISDEEANVLATALTGNTTLEVFYLNENNIGYEGANAIAQVLETNKTLKLRILGLNKNNIGDEGAKAIATALTDNTKLEALYLNENKIGDEGAKAIAQVLKTNKTLKLKILGLNKNNIGDKGAKAIAQVLETNTIFDSLYLNENKIGDEGAKAIAQVLKTETLITLYLNENIISDEGAKAIAHELKRNITLRYLQLSKNNIGMEGATALVTALRKNTTLYILDLVIMPDITDEQYNKLKKIIDDDPNERLVLRVRQ